MRLIGTLLLALTLTFTACKTKERIITVEKVRTDTTYITRHQRDSIRVQDSTHVREWQSGDTTFVEVERLMRIYIDRTVHDTLREATHDTVPRPYPVEVEVPAQLTWWQQTRLHLANIVLWLLAGAAIVRIMKKKII